LAVAGEAGSPAVEIYPKFSAFGINGGYYYARARLSFR
jgi:iron complex outermembrane receptor protein